MLELGDALLGEQAANILRGQCGTQGRDGSLEFDLVLEGTGQRGLHVCALPLCRLELLRQPGKLRLEALDAPARLEALAFGLLERFRERAPLVFNGCVGLLKLPMRCVEIRLVLLFADTAGQSHRTRERDEQQMAWWWCVEGATSQWQ